MCNFYVEQLIYKLVNKEMIRTIANPPPIYTEMIEFSVIF